MRKIADIAIIGIGAAGAVMCLISGNLPGAIAFGLLAGISIMNVATGGDLWGSIINGLKGIWDGLKTWFLGEVKPKFTTDYWSKLFGVIKDGATAKIGETRTSIINGWNNIKSYFGEHIAPKFTKE
jgi:hypothetical protein